MLAAMAAADANVAQDVSAYLPSYSFYKSERQDRSLRLKTDQPSLLTMQTPPADSWEAALP